MMKDLRLGEVLDQVDSRSATPGGGSVAAVVGEFGLCLARMYAHLSIHKKAFGQLDELKQQRFVEVHQRLAENRQEMERLALEDMEAYKKVSEAYRNKQGIDESLEGALAVPCRLCILAYQSMKDITEILNDGNPNALSDALSGLSLLYAAIECSYLNIVINARCLHLNVDDERVGEMKKLMKEAAKLKQKHLFCFYGDFM